MDVAPYRAASTVARDAGKVRVLCFLSTNVSALATLLFFAGLSAIMLTTYELIDRELAGNIFAVWLFPIVLVTTAHVIVVSMRVRLFTVAADGVFVRGLPSSSRLRASWVTASGSRLVVTTATGVLSLGVPSARFWDSGAQGARAEGLALTAQSALDAPAEGTRAVDQGSPVAVQSACDVAPGSPWAWFIGGALALAWLCYLWVARALPPPFWFAPGMCGPVLHGGLCVAPRPPGLTAIWAAAGGLSFVLVAGVGLSSLGRPLDADRRIGVRFVIFETPPPFLWGWSAFSGESHLLAAWWLPSVWLCVVVGHILLIVWFGFIVIPMASLAIPQVSVPMALHLARLISGARLLKADESGVQLRIDGAWLRITSCEASGLWLVLHAGELPIWCRFPTIRRPSVDRKADALAEVAGVISYLRSRIVLEASAAPTSSTGGVVS